ncbi:MAG: phosphoribosylformylglycinamidine synthase [Treponema sp.]|jgi:phosphoribosylformylglycinamidine synthase|nr:phosphoribosylformylglycinamidine synthase [Treponema sp.]
MPIKRVFVEKRRRFDWEARRLKTDLAGFLGNPKLAAAALRILYRYDVQGLDDEQFNKAVRYVFSEPQCDRVFIQDRVPALDGDLYFGIEYLPGQYDQKADSASQCVELAVGVKPKVHCAKIHVLSGGALDAGELDAVKKYLVNPVDSRIIENSNELPDTLDRPVREPSAVPVLNGFIRATAGGLSLLAGQYGLAMSAADLVFCRDYFANEKRDPSLAELRVLDTYWSDHCRHTTFNTILENIKVANNNTEIRAALELYNEARKEVYGKDSGKKCSLMDMALIGAKVLKKRGMLCDVDESKEINACTIKINAQFASQEGITKEPWLLLFKNETHNHPTEIEPFGGAATCLGGAIRDPLSGRAYVYQAMRISGSGDPRVPPAQTVPGKLPQIKIVREAAAGYSSYGNQIGLATGQVAEFYHQGYIAKHLELGAVIAAVPEAQVKRAEPEAGDVVLLIGGATGRDGIGGATGSSKMHSDKSVESAGAEVQKGNAVEERKLQRLFRRSEVSCRIKRCNDFGAGGVSVAVGELAAGLDIDLDAAPKKYAGLDGIELAISESQERMAVVCAPQDAPALIAAAAGENLEAVVIAKVTTGDKARLRMFWQKKMIVDLSRDFLDSNGAPRSADALISIESGELPSSDSAAPSLLQSIKAELASLRSCSRRGLQEHFDGSVGAGSVLFPWGGKEQATPECGMAALIPSLEKPSLTASIMCFGFDPELSSKNPYKGAKAAVKEALAKFACLGGDPFGARLSMQEYFERMENSVSWGKAAAALLGALEAQLALGVPAIGGKDSMSGTYRDADNDISVPPSIIVFAAGTTRADRVRSGALCGGGNTVLLFDELNNWDTFRSNLKAFARLVEADLVKAAYPVGAGGAGVSLALMCFGNEVGVEITPFKNQPCAGSFLAEIADIKKAREILEQCADAQWTIAARTTAEKVFRLKTPAETAEVSLDELRGAYEETLSAVYPQSSNAAYKEIPPYKNAHTRTRRRRPPAVVHPLVVLPVFPGTNCEYDMDYAFRRAGARTRQIIFRNRGAADIGASINELAAAINEAQIVALSGGFSAGDEPDGSGKFIANALRSPAIVDAVRNLLEKRGLMLGICNGFQALIKLGLVPYGRYIEARETSPALTFNNIGRHVSRMVRTRVMSTLSPWLFSEEAGAVHTIPVSHGEGRLVLDETEAQALFDAGQIPFCYVDRLGNPAMAEPDNPNGSSRAIEGLTSPDGHILGKMGHSERCGEFVHVNIPGNKNQRIFESGVSYFAG